MSELFARELVNVGGFRITVSIVLIAVALLFISSFVMKKV